MARKAHSGPHGSRRKMMHGSVVRTSLLALLCFALSSCVGLQTAPNLYGLNSLTVKNGTGEFALVRIKAPGGATQAELAIEPGKSNTCYLGGGWYYEVVRFGRDKVRFRYAKGEGFDLSTPPGQYVQATLTLHGVVNGNYSTHPATAADFQ